MKHNVDSKKLEGLIAEIEKNIPTQIRVAISKNNSHSSILQIYKYEAFLLLLLLLISWKTPFILTIIVILFILIQTIQHFFSQKESKLKFTRLNNEARSLFYTHEMTATQFRNGLLIYFAPKDKFLCLLPDIWLLQNLPENFWDQQVLKFKSITKNKDLSFQDQVFSFLNTLSNELNHHIGTKEPITNPLNLPTELVNQPILDT